ncbi:MAG TPA: hypothetical protein VN651_20200 [Gemmatimonadaceae bacterium]|nr:hypothetical protein [Gemmatimonadaceae bacterium]
MNRRLTLGSALLFAAALACGGSDATGPSNAANGPSTACSITLSGGKSGPLTCSNFAAILTANDNETEVGMQGADAAGDTLDVALGFPGAPTVRAYGTADLSPVLLLFSATDAWTAGPGNGTVSLTITSVKVLNSGAGLTSYEIHGTLAATPSVEAGSGGPVTVAATF